MAARDASGQLPVLGYNTSNRGYPDLSFAAINFLVRVTDSRYPSGVTTVMAGTSASCPVAAGIFSNINAARLAAGKGSIGWVNPVLYAKGSLFVNDITVGNNKSPNFGPVCAEGYYATKGWDPTTGLGSVDYVKMQKTFLALGAVNGFSPSQAPTAFPTNGPGQLTGVPTFRPTLRPTNIPSMTPTVVPTPVPTAMPSAAPTMTPTVVPTSLPTVVPSEIGRAHV